MIPKSHRQSFSICSFIPWVGSVESNLDLDKSSLEDMGNEEWASHGCDGFLWMKCTTLQLADYTHFCAIPDGVVHAVVVTPNKELNTSH